MSRSYILLSFLVSTCLLMACHDDDEATTDAAGTEWSVTWSDGGSETSIDIYGRYYSLYTVTTGVGAAAVPSVQSPGVLAGAAAVPARLLRLSTDAEWLQLVNTTLPADGIIQVLAKANNGGAARTAEITVSDSSDDSTGGQGHPHSVVLKVRQPGLGDDRENDSDDPDPLSDYRVGWGFNAFEEYKSLNSQRGHIIDAVKLARFDSDTTFHSMQEAVRSLETFSVISAWSLQEMSMKLTKEMTSQTNVLLVKKTTRRFTEISKHSVREQACSYARLQKTVATRSMDEGALRHLVDETGIDDLPFTDNFRKAYNSVVNSSGANREKAIGELIENYGTHLIISASVGCKMDLCLTFEKSSDYEFQKETEETSKKVFGRTKKSSNSKISEHFTSDLANANSIQVSGGSEATRTRLAATIKTLTDSKVLETDLIQEWLASVSPNDLNDALRRKNLDVVDFRFMPVWDLFADDAVKADIQQYVISMASRSDCDFTDQELGLDNYRIDLNNESLARFGTESYATLVRVARSKEEPLVEICEEYVPKIRSDKRIVVYYPILEGRTRIGQGVFRGDGDYAPSMLTFSDDDVYVDPIDGYGAGDILNEVWYVHGCFYAKSFGIAMNEVQLDVTNEVFRIQSVSTPIVKIGAGYWTRRNVNESLSFGEPADKSKPEGEFIIREKIHNDMLFANIFYGNSPAFRKQYPGLFDDEVDGQSGQAIHWYLPKPENLEHLHAYIGKNVKSLFMGQVSGFDAQFVGYWGSYDEFDKTKTYSEDDFRYTDHCFVAAKESPVDGRVLVVGADYSTKIYTTNSEKPNWYPIRAYRTSYYTYK